MNLCAQEHGILWAGSVGAGIVVVYICPAALGRVLKRKKTPAFFSRGSFFYKSAELFSPAANSERERKRPEYCGKRGGFGDGDI